MASLNSIAATLSTRPKRQMRPNVTLGLQQKKTNDKLIVSDGATFKRKSPLPVPSPKKKSPTTPTKPALGDGVPMHLRKPLPQNLLAGQGVRAPPAALTLRKSSPDKLLAGQDVTAPPAALIAAQVAIFLVARPYLLDDGEAKKKQMPHPMPS